LLYHTKGGFTFNEVYNMPVYLRLYYLKRLRQQFSDEKTAYDKASKKDSKIKRPNIRKPRVRK